MVWNDLPDDICSATALSSFRRKLKTYLFSKAFQSQLFWFLPVLFSVMLTLAMSLVNWLWISAFLVRCDIKSVFKIEIKCYKSTIRPRLHPSVTSAKLTLQGSHPFLKIFTPQPKKLHWLPVRYRVQFKIGLITYKILNQGQPVYLRELIHPYTSFRNTRRSTPKLKFLHTPTFDRRVHKSIKHFSNSFSHYAPVLWNSLPFQTRNSPSVASFRKHLKTHLFNSSFPT